MKQKIEKIKDSVGCLSMAHTEEGVVLQLIDRVECKVLGLMKVKSVEYQLFRIMESVLQNAI